MEALNHILMIFVLMTALAKKSSSLFTCDAVSSSCLEFCCVSESEYVCCGQLKGCSLFSGTCPSGYTVAQYGAASFNLTSQRTTSTSTNITTKQTKANVLTSTTSTTVYQQNQTITSLPLRHKNKIKFLHHRRHHQQPQ